MQLRSVPPIFLLLCYLSYVRVTTATNYVGCYKYVDKPTGCQIKSPDEQVKLSEQLTNSIANAVEWLRQEQKENLWFDLHTSSWVMTNLVVAGYVNDNGVCTTTMENTVLQIQKALKHTSDISAGQLAMVMIGMRATCQRITKFKHQNLLKIMTANMTNFPVGEFNNYYQYSLGILALYLNGADVPAEFGMRLLQHVISNNNQGMTSNTRMSDTEALSVIALAAMLRQRGMPDKFVKEASKIVTNAAAIIDKVMETGKFENLVTMTHVLQVLQLKKNRLPTKPYCKSVFDWVLSKQDGAGSFGGLMPTSGVLPLLTGASILELRDVKCPIGTDDTVDEAKIIEFINSRKRNSTAAPAVSKDKVTVVVDLGSDVEGVSVNAHSPVTLPKGSTAMDALAEASKSDPCFRYRKKDTAWGPMIEMICKIEQNHVKKTYWMFYVNGEMAQVGAGKYVLQDHDTILFRYQRV